MRVTTRFYLEIIWLLIFIFAILLLLFGVWMPLLNKERFTSTSTKPLERLKLARDYIENRKIDISKLKT